MRALLDTNVLIRHFTGTPPSQARRATRYLAESEHLELVHLVVAETVYVLKSVYQMPGDHVAALLRAVIGHPAIEVGDVDVLLRSLALFQIERLDFVEAYLIATAEASGISAVASFDRAIDRIGTVTRVEP